MKSLFKFLLTGILLITYIQNTISQESKAISAEGIYNESDHKTYLRWAPSTSEMWYSALQNGFIIRRKRVMDSLENVVNDTPYTLDTVYRYLPAQWASLNITPEDSLLISAASGLVNDDSISILLQLPHPDSIKLSDAVRYNEAKNELFTYALLLADQNFKIAKGLGLGFIDTDTLLAGHTYMYTITLNDQNWTQGKVMLKIGDELSLSSPAKPTSIGKNLKAEISWSTEGLDKKYTFYDIYRSDDMGVNFAKVNPYPYIQMTDANLPDETSMTYVDSLPQNNVTCIYKVKGISPFGLDTPFSDTVHVKGMPPLLNINVKLDSIQVSDSVSIYWQLEKVFHAGPNDSSLVAGFNIYQREKLQDVPQKVNTSLLPDSLRQYSFTPAHATGYYYVEAVDGQNRSYVSITQLGQGIDSVPPAPPANLTGIVKEGGNVILTWDKNEEPDLIGYKVFFSNSQEGEYAQITVDVVSDTTFVTFTDLSFGLEKLFYHVRAVDKRYNLSEPSNTAVLNRPDKFAPSSPLLSHVLPRAEGVRIAWKLSSSSDVFSHYLQRKLKSGNQWQTIIDVRHETHYPPMTQLSFEMVPSNYVDTAQLAMTYYQYRLIAVDSFGNAASSEIITIKPFDDGIRGEVRNIQGTFYNLSSPNQGLLHPDLNVLVNMPNGNVNFIGKDACILRWEYGTDFPSTHRDFKIYFRFVESQGTPGGEGGGQAPPGGGSGGSSNGLDQHGDINDFKLIKTISAYNARKVADAIQYNGFAFAHEIARKDNNTLDLEYKIIATHTDGGFSLPVTIVVPGN